MFIDNKTKKKEARLVFNPGCARALLRAGCTICDIKQSRENADKSIFVFKNDEIFEREFSRINREIAESKASDEDDSE